MSDGNDSVFARTVHGPVGWVVHFGIIRDFVYWID